MLMLQRAKMCRDEQSSKELANFRDTQLERAVDALKGVMVYARARRAGRRSRCDATNAATSAVRASLILALETSCDETAVAILRGDELLASEVASQIAMHAAVRRRGAGGRLAQSSARAATRARRARWRDAGVRAGGDRRLRRHARPGPRDFADDRQLRRQGSRRRRRASLSSRSITRRPSALAVLRHGGGVRPAVGLVVSGGHTLLVEIEAFGDYRLLGQTQDDAAGEAFDKVGKLLGLPYPGGPNVNRLAHGRRSARASIFRAA